MISLYWTVIPFLLVHYYASHPLAQFNWWRSKLVIVLTLVWSLRQSHNYFRREKWQWGAREDWRFSDMRQHYGKPWWWISFFSLYFSQQVIQIDLFFSILCYCWISFLFFIFFLKLILFDKLPPSIVFFGRHRILI